ncbi:MAG: hypothetical protein HY690_16215 [Chloroflexi bacterium]|nr:hypothetical protein [Chloroflexota bacterium]
MARVTRRLPRALVWTVALVSILAACAPAQPSPPATPPAARAEATSAAPAAAKPTDKPAAPSEWVVAITEEATSLDAGTADSTNGTTLVFRHLYEPLVSYQGNPWKLTPLLAESWTVTDDRVWDFKIRKGVKFHNGDELTAADVKYSIDLYRDDKSARKSNTVDIKTIEVVDPYTIRITTDGPRPGMLANLSMLFIVPRDAREKAGVEAFNAKPIGSGPYKLVEFVRGQRLVMEANPSFWRGQVEPKRLILRPIVDPSTRVAELKAGGVHIISAPPLAQAKQLQEGNTELKLLKGGRNIMHAFNTTRPPFDDVRVRQAVNYAVDREAIIKSVLEGYAEPLHGPFVSAWLGYDPELKPYPYDPKKARQLLAEAGYPSGLETVFNITSGAFLKDREIAEAVASQLAEVGIKARLVPTERAKLQNDWLNGTFEGITSVAWGAAADPDPMLGWTFYQRKGHKPDDKLNGYIDQSRRVLDQEQRGRVLQEFGRYVHDQAYWLFIHAQDEVYAKRREISWEPIPDGQSFANVLFFRLTPR